MNPIKNKKVRFNASKTVSEAKASTEPATIYFCSDGNRIILNGKDYSGISNSELAEAISTNSADFKGTFNTLEELQAVENVNNNDYGFVIRKDSTIKWYDRYKYVESTHTWLYEFSIESTELTEAQFAALNSGIRKGNGIASIVEGVGTDASGNFSHAEGVCTIIHKPGGHASGRFNVDDIATFFVIGMGTDSSNRKDALCIIKPENSNDGKLYLIGVGGFDGTNHSLAKALQQCLPNDVTRTQTDCTVVNKDSLNNITNLFYIRQATSQLAGLLSAEMYNKLNSLPNPSSVVTVEKLFLAIDAHDLDVILENRNWANKTFVNSSVATNTATFRGTYTTYEAIPVTGIDNNDYVFLVQQDQAGNTVYKRYKWNANQQTPGWVFEYDLNNSSFTAAQWASIQSGITAALVQKLNDLPTNASLITSLENKVDKVSGKGLSANDYTNNDKEKLTNIPLIGGTGTDSMRTDVNNTASGRKSVAIGDGNNVSGAGAVAFGGNNGNIAEYGFTAGYGNQVQRNMGFTIGHSNIIRGWCSGAFGYALKTFKEAEIAVGKWNLAEEGLDIIFAVGIGTGENDRRNAFTVYADGTVKFAKLVEIDNNIVEIQANLPNGVHTDPTEVEILHETGGLSPNLLFTIPGATSNSAGVMTAADKTKLDSLPTSTLLTSLLEEKQNKVIGRITETLTFTKQLLMPLFSNQNNWEVGEETTFVSANNLNQGVTDAITLKAGDKLIITAASLATMMPGYINVVKCIDGLVSDGSVCVVVAKSDVAGNFEYTITEDGVYCVGMGVGIGGIEKERDLTLEEKLGELEARIAALEGNVYTQ